MFSQNPLSLLSLFIFADGNVINLFVHNCWEMAFYEFLEKWLLLLLLILRMDETLL